VRQSGRTTFTDRLLHYLVEFPEDQKNDLFELLNAPTK